MNHGVTIRAYRPQVLNRIYCVYFANKRDWRQMVDMNHVGTYFSIGSGEIKLTDNTPITVMLQTLCSGFSVSFIHSKADGDRTSLMMGSVWFYT